jgi:hypothetical protein
LGRYEIGKGFAQFWCGGVRKGTVGECGLGALRPRPIEVERLAGVLEHLDNARHWN